MKKMLALVLLVPSLAFAAAGVWAPISGLSRSTTFTCTTAGVTCDAPTLATEGTNLANVGAVVVTACAASTKTLSGAGNLRAYVYDPTTALWARAPDLDLATGTASVRCVTWPAIYVPGPAGRVAWVTDTVTASSNSVTVYIKAFAPMVGDSPGKPL
jgi:hypothetical protein